MRCGSRRVLILIAEWQAIEAAMRVRAASRFSDCISRSVCSRTSVSMRSSLAAFEANRGGLDRDGARAEGFGLEAVALQLGGDAGEDDHLLRQQIDQHGHQQLLPLHTLDLALAQDFFKEHALVGDMLVDDPQGLRR